MVINLTTRRTKQSFVFLAGAPEMFKCFLLRFRMDFVTARCVKRPIILICQRKTPTILLKMQHHLPFMFVHTAHIIQTELALLTLSRTYLSRTFLRTQKVSTRSCNLFRSHIYNTAPHRTPHHSLDLSTSYCCRSLLKMDCDSRNVK